MPGMKTHVWPAVALVGVAMVCVAAVVIIRPDAVAHLQEIVALIVVPLLVALVAQINAVRHQTNGATSELLAQLKTEHEKNARLMELLAAAPPSPLAGVLEPFPASQGTVYRSGE